MLLLPRPQLLPLIAGWVLSEVEEEREEMQAPPLEEAEHSEVDYYWKVVGTA